ncbi:MAG: TatD family hydrolase [Candidatus Woesearchaeota archaeon]
MTMFIDLHCHLDHYLFESDIPIIISNARKAGIKHLVVSGISPKSNRFALSLAQKFPEIVKASIGLYPIDALQNEILSSNVHKEILEFSVDSELEFIERNRRKIVALGEMGLDYKTGERKDDQKHLFIRQLELAKRLRKPVIIHSRHAEEDVLDILGGYKLNVVLHCFSGNKRLVKRASDLGYYFTIPTHVVRSQQFQDIIRAVPLSQLFCETDSPYLSPFANRRNEPAFVVESYKKIAEIKGTTLLETGHSIYMNWQRVFE